MFKHRVHSSQSHPIVRHWQCQSSLNFSSKDFILPIFVAHRPDANEPIEKFPGVNRLGLTVLVKTYLPKLMDAGLHSVILFPCPEQKDQSRTVTDVFNPEKNPLLLAVPAIKNNFPHLFIITDVCLCGFTESGHCCTFDSIGRINNNQSVELVTKLALMYAEAGADCIAPSDMMDSRVNSIRSTLKKFDFNHVSIMSYAAKFASCLYGPYRSAAGSAPKFGNRKQYQLPSGSKGLALRCIERDMTEGADMIMVKPSMTYLDIVSRISSRYPDYPIAVYQVSGEYTMLKYAAERGLFDLKSAVIETLISYKRAGASIIITYFTPDILEWIKSGHIDTI